MAHSKRNASDRGFPFLEDARLYAKMFCANYRMIRMTTDYYLEGEGEYGLSRHACELSAGYCRRSISYLTSSFLSRIANQHQEVSLLLCEESCSWRKIIFTKIFLPSPMRDSIHLHSWSHPIDWQRFFSIVKRDDEDCL